MFPQKTGLYRNVGSSFCATVKYHYDNNGALAVVSDSGSGITTTYFYDFTDRLMKYTEKIENSFSHVVGYEYDNINNLTALVETINGTSYTTSYAYDDDNRVISVANADVNEAYTYDEFGRLKDKTTKRGTSNVLTEKLAYRDITVTTDNGTVNTTTGQVSNLTVDIANADRTDISFVYTYDANGNITQVVSGGKTTKYTYDKANQLIREDNEAANKTWTWTYDNAGNILSRKTYAYTTGTLGPATETDTYTYNNTNWGDLLTSYQVGSNAAVAITSDTIGNMTQFGAWTYSWEHGRELQSMQYDVGNDNNTANDTKWEFIYNADGLRTMRTNGSTTYNYVYNGSSLSQMSVGTNLLNFVYDASGSPMAVTYNGTTYYYVTNLQGDVVAILDSNGTSMVKYTYNAWGKLLSTTGTMATTLGVHNPLRYRGYVYDPETGLYYVSSRYYDPQLGRFINADALVSTGQGLLGNNMFAYCTNNPMNYVDRDGANAEALQWWTTGMVWLPLADTVLPIGDIIYISGILLLGAIALSSDQNYVPEISYAESDVAYGPPSPNNDDDDDYDDYYDDESNFGGRQIVGKNKGNAPGNNQAQNKQFRDATKGLTPDQQRTVHDEITGKGLGYNEIKAVIKDLFVFVGGLFTFEEW